MVLDYALLDLFKIPKKEKPIEPPPLKTCSEAAVAAAAVAAVATAASASKGPTDKDKGNEKDKGKKKDNDNAAASKPLVPHNKCFVCGSGNHPLAQCPLMKLIIPHVRVVRTSI